MNWNREEHDAMVECLLEGLSASQTAKVLTKRFGREFSRNSVISRANRKNVPFAVTAEKRQRGGAASRAIAKAKLALPGHVRPALPVEPIPEDDPNDIPLRTLDELGDDHCRWPIDGPFKGWTFGFCGREKRKGLPYCSKHCQRAFNAPEIVSRNVSEQREREAQPA